MPLSTSLRKLARCFGLDVRRWRPENFVAERRARFLTDNAIDLVLDIGANAGNYGTELRQHGYAGRIVSFEPLADAYRQLSARAESDPAWDCHQLALGDSTGQTSINVSANSVSSSLLGMADRHVRSAPESAYVATEEIDVRRLDDMFADIRGSAASVMLKADVQGFERAVLDGAIDALKHISMIEIELSLTQLYQGQVIADDLLKYLRGAGFTPVSLERGFTDPKNLHILQCDAILIRDGAAGV